MDPTRELINQGPRGLIVLFVFLVCAFLRKRYKEDPNGALWAKVPERFRWAVPFAITSVVAIAQGVAAGKPWQEILAYLVPMWLAAMGLGGFYNGIVDPSGNKPSGGNGDGEAKRIYFEPPGEGNPPGPLMMVAALIGALVLGGCASQQVPKFPLEQTAKAASVVVDTLQTPEGEQAKIEVMLILAELAKDEPDPETLCTSFRGVLPAAKQASEAFDQPERTYVTLVIVAVNLWLGSDLCSR